MAPARRAPDSARRRRAVADITGYNAKAAEAPLPAPAQAAATGDNVAAS
jgi:hypothetical protein